MDYPQRCSVTHQCRTEVTPCQKTVYRPPSMLSYADKHPPLHKLHTYPTTKIHCIYTNADILPNKLDELKARIACSDPPPPRCYSDHRNCRYPLQEKEIAIPGYQLFSNINQQGISIRGTVIYTHSSLKATDYVLTSEFADSIWVKIHLNNNDNLIIGCVYRSPNSTPENNDNFLALLFRVAETDPSHLLILGDINLPDINWNTMTTNHSNLLHV